MGNDLKFMQGTPEACIVECSATPECMGLVYIIPGISAWPEDRACAFKKKMCEKTTMNMEHIDTSFFKISEGGNYSSLDLFRQTLHKTLG